MSDMSMEHIRVVDDAGPVAELVLDRPKIRNAMSPQMGEEIRAAVAQLNSATHVRAVIVRGEGRSFSAGGDFSLMETCIASSPAQNRERMRWFYGLYLSVLDLRVPSIVAIHGHAVGAGLCFALACDLRLCADDAELAVNFVRIALHPGMAATLLVPRLVGPARAAELLLTGKMIGSEEALRIGLVNRVVPAEDLLDATRTLAREIASAGPLAVAATKASLQRPLKAALEEALEVEADQQAVSYATADLREAVAAFRAKRPPSFIGE